MKVRAGLIGTTVLLPTLLGFSLTFGSPAFAVTDCEAVSGENFSQCSETPAQTTQPSPAPTAPIAPPTQTPPSPQPTVPASTPTATAPVPSPSATTTAPTPSPTSTQGTAAPAPVLDNAPGDVGNSVVGGGQVPVQGGSNVPVDEVNGYVITPGAPAVPAQPSVEANKEIDTLTPIVQEASSDTISQEKNWPLAIAVILGALGLAVGIVVYGVKKYGAPFSKQ